MHQFTSCLGTFVRGRLIRDLSGPVTPAKLLALVGPE